jgi:Putative transmembrane protein (PGPGW)
MQVPAWITNLKRPGSLWGTIVGWLCIGVGLLGLVLPVIPGVVFLAAGLFILSARYAWAAFCLKWLKRRLKKLPVRGRPRKTTGKDVERGVQTY